MEALRERNVANVLVDGPGLHVTTEQTADHSYYLFHGRNYDIWYGQEKEDDHRLERYDYLYSRDQLEPWVARSKELRGRLQEKARIYFNNHARAKSIRNGFLLMDMLLIEHKQKEIKLQDQFTLGEF